MVSIAMSKAPIPSAIGANEGGLIKFDSRPVGGGRSGVLDGSTPGGN